MQLKRLDIQNLRIIREASVDTDSPLVVFCGGNASGKTSLLEAAHIVFCGRSFRTRHSTQLINSDSDGYLVRALVDNSSASGVSSLPIRVATQLKTKQSPRFRLSDEDVRPSQLAKLFPVQLVDASVFDLISGSPANRRRFFDWGMFHVKHEEFYTLWQKQRKLAAHWGALLRKGAAAELDYWKAPFAGVTERLAAIRQAYLEELRVSVCSPEEQEKNRSMFGGEIELSLNRGWPDGLGYLEHLDSSLGRDLKERRLRSGAHFFDLGMFVGGKPLKDVLSRGQIKLFGLKLKLAQIKLYNALPDKDSCLVLIDDLAAEIDLENQKKALGEILAAGSQVLYTAVDQSLLEAVIPQNVDAKMFHVKHGEITEFN